MARGAVCRNMTRASVGTGARGEGMGGRNRGRSAPALEALEGRLVPSASFGTQVGVVSSPGAVARTSAAVGAGNLSPGKPSTLFRLSARPQPGSPLLPALVQ